MLYSYNSNANLKNFFKPPTLPRDLQTALTFWAPLVSVLDAHGKGTTGATYTRASVATHVDAATGLVVRDASGVARFEASGYFAESQRTNLALYSDDFTQAAWTLTSMTAAATSTGPDGGANTASRLTATAANATVLQAITSTSAARITSVWIKRIIGTGEVDMTQDNGTTWTAVTVTTAWTRVSIAGATLANPTVGIRLVNNGDAVDVSLFQHEVSSFVSSAIPTAAAAVQRNVERLSYAGSSNFPINSPVSVYIKVNSLAGSQAGNNAIWTHATAANTNTLNFFFSSATGIRITSFSPTTTQVDTTTSKTVPAEPSYTNIFVSYFLNLFQATLDDVLAFTDTSCNYIGVSGNINIGGDAFGSATEAVNGHISTNYVFMGALSLFDMAKLTG